VCPSRPRRQCETTASRVRTVVVGAGAAGLWAALHAADRGPVTIVAPDPSAGSSTALAQGGIAAAVAEGDRPESHAADTIAAGAGLCDPEVVRILTAEAPAAIAELRAFGMTFDAGGAPTLEGGHTARRVLHAGGDATGWYLLRTLLGAVRADDRIEWTPARVAALVSSGERATGIRTTGGEELEADRVILATGGATGIFGRRTGPDRATGQGMALAWDAGAALADLEFVQFHPTALDVPGHPARLLTEALRGEGAVLLDADGERFMPRVDPRAELAPRDVVARAIASVRDATGRPVLLDARAISDVRSRFPTVAASCREAGLDLARDLIPVAPAAHYFTGGVLTDAWARTTVPGLVACGEVACTGVHGANRLASNSLLEALVFGRRAALAEEGPGPAPTPLAPLDPLPEGSLPLEEIRTLTDHSLGVSRNGPELEAVCGKLGAASQPDGDRPALLVATLLARAALRREESRGGHYRTDFAETRPKWQVHQIVSPSGWASSPQA
jgi:L-aspartate oxidase